MHTPKLGFEQLWQHDLTHFFLLEQLCDARSVGTLFQKQPLGQQKIIHPCVLLA